MLFTADGNFARFTTGTQPYVRSDRIIKLKPSGNIKFCSILFQMIRLLNVCSQRRVSEDFGD